MFHIFYCSIFMIFYFHATSALLHTNRHLQSKIYHPTEHVGDPLILTPYLEENRIQDAQDDAKVHFDEFGDVVSYSGYFTINKTADANIFFWFFPSANDYSNDPVLLWLQGGPGSSSMFGLFVENGPFMVEDNGTVTFRNYSWHKNHSLLFIDQPVGTGFSFTNGSLVTDEIQVGEQLYSTLIQFFTLFPELQKNEFYISGESYAGKYVPAIGHTILQKNNRASWKINLKGLLIGNGLSDPIHQLYYGAFLYQLGFIDNNTLQIFKDNEDLFKKYLQQEKYENATDAFFTGVNNYKLYTDLHNIYNFLLEKENFPSAYKPFLNRVDVRQAIHVGNQAWTYANIGVYYALYDDISQSVAPWVSELLSNYRVLIYNGQLDVIVAYVLTENYLLNLNFSSAAEYKVAPRNIWRIGNDHVAGYVKTAGNLTEVAVRNAGHAVPFDQPEAAYELVYNFTRNILKV